MASLAISPNVPCLSAFKLVLLCIVEKNICGFSLCESASIKDCAAFTFSSLLYPSLQPVYFFSHCVFLYKQEGSVYR